MKTKALSLVVGLLVCLPLAAGQEWAKQKLEKSPRHSEWVEIKHDGRSVQAFVVYPESKQKAPVVIVIEDSALASPLCNESGFLALK